MGLRTIFWERGWTLILNLGTTRRDGIGIYHTTVSFLIKRPELETTIRVIVLKRTAGGGWNIVTKHPGMCWIGWGMVRLSDHSQKAFESKHNFLSRAIRINSYVPAIILRF